MCSTNTPTEYNFPYMQNSWCYDSVVGGHTYNTETSILFFIIQQMYRTCMLITHYIAYMLSLPV